MLAWETLDARLLVVLAVGTCVIIVTLQSLISWPSKDHRQQVRVLDGNHLYYDGKPWPVYDMKFNLRLSRLYDEPVLVIKQGPAGFLATLCRLFNCIFYSASEHANTTVLINSWKWGEDGTLKRLLTDAISRAPSIVAGKYLSRGRRIVLMPYGPDWKRHQTAFAKLLTRTKVKKEWAPALRFEALVMVDALRNRSSDGKLVEEISRFTASSVLQIAYSRRAATLDDPVLKSLKIISTNMKNAFEPGKYLVAKFPILDIFPAWISPWKRKLNADHAFEMSVFRDLLDAVLDDLLGEDERQDPDVQIPVEQCAAAQLLHSEEQFDVDEIAYLTAGLFEAGTETTAMTITTFLLGAAANRKNVELAQIEIGERLDNGRDRGFPSAFEDLEGFSSGYVSGFVREALRLTPTCSSGMTHNTTKSSLHYMNVHRNGKGGVMLDIPSGATVLASNYGLHHDERAFLDPGRFDPTRWLPWPQDTLDFTLACAAFGFGKRRCPGSRLASYSVTMAIVLLLWCYDFELDCGKARIFCDQIEEYEVAERRDWERRFPNEAIDAETIFQAEDAHEGGPLSEHERICRTLIDAHTRHKIVGAQVSKCIRLKPRLAWGNGAGKTPLDKVEETLARMRK